MELEQIIVTVGLAGLLVGGGFWYERASLSEKRHEAARQVLLLQLPKDDEDRYKELIRLSDTIENVDDALGQAKGRANDLILERHSAAVMARRKQAQLEKGGAS
jgi:hypothetical protein